MMKLKGQEVPVSLYKFYLHDVLEEKLEFIKTKLDMKTNSEAFSKLILHVYGELHQMQEWLEKQSKETKSEEKN